MLQTRPSLALLSTILLVACGEPKTIHSPEELGLQYCGEGGEPSTWDEGLVESQGDVRSLELRLVLGVSRRGMMVDGDTVSGGADLANRLAQKLDETTRIAAEHETIIVVPDVLLSVHGDVPVDRVLEASAIAFEGGWTPHWVVVRRPPRPEPDYLEPEVATSFLAELAGLAAGPAEYVEPPGLTTNPSPSLRHERYTELLTEEAQKCPAAVRVFKAIPKAEPERKCEVLEEGIETIQAKCSEEEWRRLITLMQVGWSAELAGFPVGVLRPTLTQDGESLLVDPGTLWREVVTLLGATDLDQVKLEIQAIEAAE
jgi:hypothetical protein